MLEDVLRRTQMILIDPLSHLHDAVTRLRASVTQFESDFVQYLPYYDDLLKSAGLVIAWAAGYFRMWEGNQDWQRQCIPPFQATDIARFYYTFETNAYQIINNALGFLRQAMKGNEKMSTAVTSNCFDHQVTGLRSQSSQRLVLLRDRWNGTLRHLQCIDIDPVGVLGPAFCSGRIPLVRVLQYTYCGALYRLLSA